MRVITLKGGVAASALLVFSAFLCVSVRAQLMTPISQARTNQAEYSVQFASNFGSFNSNLSTNWDVYVTDGYYRYLTASAGQLSVIGGSSLVATGSAAYAGSGGYGSGASSIFSVTFQINNPCTYTLNGDVSAELVSVQVSLTGPGGTILQAGQYMGSQAFQTNGILFNGQYTLSAAAAGGGDSGGSGSYGLDMEFQPLPFQITSVAAQSNNVLLTWTTTGGSINVVQASNGDASGNYSNNYFNLSPLLVIPGSGATNASYVDVGGATNFPSRYYRVAVAPATLYTVTPAELDFGPVLGFSSAQQAFVVANNGVLPINSGQATVTGGPFSIVSGSTFTLAPGGSTNVVVQFAPTSVGGFTDAVVFSTEFGPGPTNVVTGTGYGAPVASFSASPTSGTAPLIVMFTDTSTGVISNWFWNFGDGATTNVSPGSITHTYAGLGTYTVSLTASGPVGASTQTQSNLILVATPPQISVSPLLLNFGTVIVGQTSTGVFDVINTGGLPLTGTASAPLPYSISSGSAFNVAGGQTGIVTVVFTPSTAGTFNTNILFTSNGGAWDGQMAGTGVSPLAALFSASPTNGTAALTVTFVDTSTGAISNRFWSFGDGSTTNIASAGITHTYLRSGTDTVTLVVSGPLGAGTNTQPNLIVVNAQNASDTAADPAYNGGWTNGANGGSGFSPWVLTGSTTVGGNNNGFFVGSSTNNAFVTSPGIDTSGRSWGIYANNGNDATAYRGFNSSLLVGGTVKVDMDNGFIDSGNADGFVLRSGNANAGYTNYNTNARFEFLYIGASASNSYQVVDSSGRYYIGVGFTGTGLHLVFTLGSNDTYSLTVIDNASSATDTVVNGTLQAASPDTIDSIAVYDHNAGATSTNDCFFNSLKVTSP